MDSEDLLQLSKDDIEAGFALLGLSDPSRREQLRQLGKPLSFGPQSDLHESEDNTHAQLE